jgi:hypothetical protein
MSLYRLTKNSIDALPETSLSSQGLQERKDLQRLLRGNFSAVADDVLIIAEEFAEWDDSKRRIDLLGIDRDANLVVIELKRDDDGAHMELQAIRYAAMVSSMTFGRAVDVYQQFLSGGDNGKDARSALLQFLQWDEPREDEFGRDIRIILVAKEFSKELTTAVLWLNERDLDIRCVRFNPYSLGSEIILDVQQVVPLPEAEDYQVRVREKAMSRREAVRQGNEPTGYWFMNTGDGSNEGRAWEDCKKYGFMIAGGGGPWIDAVRKLKVGDKFFAYLSGHGYVGLGEVTAEAVPQREFVPAGQSKRLIDLPLNSTLQRDRLEDPQQCDWCASVRWINARERKNAVLKHRARRGPVEQIRKPELVAELLQHFPDSAAHG